MLVEEHMEAMQLEGGHARLAGLDPLSARLTAVDWDVLELVCTLRVITQTQIECLLGDVPGRTLRYRARRLHGLGLLGRSRPYRERGSAPHHLWPTSRGDALVRGERRPRRGERPAPSPLFLAHNAAISGLYVALQVGGSDAGIELAEFKREGEAREAFTDAEGGSRAIAPDVRLALRGHEAGWLVANVEMDLGTMSHARLRKKVDGYLSHAETAAGETAAAVPMLLFVTTSPFRAEAMHESASRARVRCGPNSAAARLPIGVCDLAERLDEVLTARRWRMVGDDGRRTLGELMDVAGGRLR